MYTPTPRRTYTMNTPTHRTYTHACTNIQKNIHSCVHQHAGETYTNVHTPHLHTQATKTEKKEKKLFFRHVPSVTACHQAEDSVFKSERQGSATNRKYVRWHMLLRSLSQFWILNTCLLIRHFTNLLASHFIEYKNDLITQRNHITSFHSLRNCPQSRRKKQGISGSEIWVVQSYLIVQREPPQLSCRTERLFTRTFFSWLQMETHQ